MRLIWKRNDEDEYIAKSGYYVLIVGQWGRRNFSWEVRFKNRAIAYCGHGETVRTLVDAKEKCRYYAERHYDKLKVKKYGIVKAN